MPPHVVRAAWVDDSKRGLRPHPLDDLAARVGGTERVGGPFRESAPAGAAKEQ